MAKPVELIDRDLGLKKILKAARDGSKLRSDVGVFEDAGGHPDAGMSVAALATIQEFGIVDPPRSFLRSTVDENKRVIERRLAESVGDITAGKKPKDALNDIGVEVRQKVIAKILSNDFQPLAAITVARKGHDQFLIDSATVIDSINTKVRKV